MHSIAKKELIKKGIELADTIVAIFELDEKIDDVLGVPWKINDSVINAENLKEIEELTKKYNFKNKGDIIYEERKRREELERNADKNASFIAIIFCIILYTSVGYLLLKLLLSI